MNGHALNDALFSFVTGHAVLGRLVLTSVEFAVLALAVGALIFVLRLRQPRLRALLWLMVLAKPLVGLALGTPLPLFLLTPPALPEVNMAAEPPVAVSQPLDLTRITPQYAMDPVEAFAPVSAPVDTGALALKAALGVWLAGCAAMGLRLLVNYIRLHRLIRAAAAPNAWLEGRLAEAARSLKLNRGHLPGLRITGKLESPALAGFWRPVILVPAWLCAEADPLQVDWSLRHELMHWRLRDPLASLLRELARIFFFFHPAAWWAGRKWQEATEMACDRALIHSMEDAEMYVQELYRMLLKVRAQRRVPVAGGLFAGRTQISQRIASLARDPLRAPARLSAATVGLVMLLSVASLSVGVGIKSQAADGPEAWAKSASIPGVVLGKKAGLTTTTARVRITADKLNARGESGLELAGSVRYGLDFGSFAAVVAGDRIDVSPNAVAAGWLELKIGKIPPEAREAKLVELARAALKKGAVESVWSSADHVTVISAQKECRLEGNAILVQRITPDKLRVYRSGLIFLNEEAPGRPRVAISGKGSANGIATTEIDLESNVSPRAVVNAAAPVSQSFFAMPVPGTHVTPMNLFDTIRGDSLEIDEEHGMVQIEGKAGAAVKMGTATVELLADALNTTVTKNGQFALRLTDLNGKHSRGQLLKMGGKGDDDRKSQYYRVTAGKALIAKDKIVLTENALVVPEHGAPMQAETFTLTPDAKAGELHIEPSSEKYPIEATPYRPKAARAMPKKAPFIYLTWKDVRLEPMDPAQLEKGFKLVLTAVDVDPKKRMAPFEATGKTVTSEAGQKRIVLKGDVKVSDGKSLEAKADELVCAEQGGHVVLTLTGKPEVVQAKNEEKRRAQADTIVITPKTDGLPTITLIAPVPHQNVPRIEVSGTRKEPGNGLATSVTTEMQDGSSQRPAVSDADRLAAEDLAATGWLLWQQRKLAEAEAAFKKSLEKNPNEANTWNGLGWAQLNQGKQLNAKKSFGEALKCDPKQAAALNGLGWIAKGAGKTDEAIGYWKRAVEAVPEATAALAGLAQTYLEQKNYKEAQRAYEQWLKAEPNSAEAKAGLEKAKAGAAGKPRVMIDIPKQTRIASKNHYENLQVTPLAPADPAKGVKVILGDDGGTILAGRVASRDPVKKELILDGGVTVKQGDAAGSQATATANRVILKEIEGWGLTATLEGKASLTQDKGGQKTQAFADVIKIDKGADGMPRVSLIMQDRTRQPKIEVFDKSKTGTLKKRELNPKEMKQWGEIVTPHNE